MHIIIPMSGLGTRFIQAGYKEPKPLIKIDGKPIIEHVCDLFPGEEKITFICSDEHLNTTPMREILNRIRPRAKIVAIDPHKLGPVFAVSKMFDQIDEDEEVIVNYCDFGAYWNYHDFIQHTRTRQADGAIPAYKHFHPHMLGPTNYAFMRDNQQWMEEIQEKKPFTDNRLEEYASSGTYYFKHGRYLKKYFQKLMDLGLDLNGEYYVSMVYNLLHQDNLKISIYEIQHMLQWGTPEDLEEYNEWSNYFRRLVEKPSQHISLPTHHVNLVPMAGHGSRFQKEGYTLPKPLIPVSGRPMVVQASAALPMANEWRFVCLSTHLNQYPLRETIQHYYSNANITSLESVTSGQAVSCAAGLENVADNASLFIAACDNSMLFNTDYFEKLAASPDVDGVVFTFKNHPSVKRNPHMYGYVTVDEQDRITGVSVKVPVSSVPTQDHAIVGAFYFKNTTMFHTALTNLQAKDIRVNGEFYVDSLIQELILSGYRLKPLKVDHYICWGTPDDLRTFEYWQSFFHKVTWHPYRLHNDHTIDAHKIHELESRYTHFLQGSV